MKVCDCGCYLSLISNYSGKSMWMDPCCCCIYLPQDKILLGRPGYGWEDNIKTGFKATVCEDVK